MQILAILFKKPYTFHWKNTHLSEPWCCWSSEISELFYGQWPLNFSDNLIVKCKVSWTKWSKSIRDLRQNGVKTEYVLYPEGYKLTNVWLTYHAIMYLYHIAVIICKVVAMALWYKLRSKDTAFIRQTIEKMFEYSVGLTIKHLDKLW